MLVDRLPLSSHEQSGGTDLLATVAEASAPTPRAVSGKAQSESLNVGSCRVSRVSRVPSAGDVVCCITEMKGPR